jgi:hypothetical protein
MYQPTTVSLLGSPLMADTSSFDQFGLNAPALAPRAAPSPWAARLFDHLNKTDPNNPYQLRDDDKRNLIR